jgi:vesicle coat complex subunit
VSSTETGVIFGNIVYEGGGTSERGVVACSRCAITHTQPVLLLLLLLQVSSTETGVIFGNIVYEGGGTSERGVVVLADIHIDIMDYISPASCADVTFRNMWAEFEWENKVRGGGAGWVWGGGRGVHGAVLGVS